MFRHFLFVVCCTEWTKMTINWWSFISKENRLHLALTTFMLCQVANSVTKWDLWQQIASYTSSNPSPHSTGMQSTKVSCQMSNAICSPLVMRRESTRLNLYRHEDDQSQIWRCLLLHERAWSNEPFCWWTNMGGIDRFWCEQTIF